MPNRILKDSICTSDNLDALTPEQEVFWYRLLVQCDDYGRMDARPAILRAKCFPLKLATITEDWIAGALQVLADVNLIRLYVIGGKSLLQVVTWENHQQIRAKRSKYPPMLADDGGGSAMISDDINGNHVIADAPVIQSNLNPNQNPILIQAAPPPGRDEGLTPEQRAINNAYDASGIVMSKTHQTEHLETVKRYGLPAWQTGFAAALAAGKHNVPAYVRRCAESAHIAETREGQHATSGRNGSGAGKPFGLRRQPGERASREPTAEERAEFYAATGTG